MDTLHTTAPKSRVRRSADQWRTILQRFERSGLSARAFCRREGLVVSSLQRWLRQLTVESTARRPDFVELRPTPPPVSSALSWTIELELPDGPTLRIRS